MKVEDLHGVSFDQLSAFPPLNEDPEMVVKRMKRQAISSRLSTAPVKIPVVSSEQLEALTDNSIFLIERVTKSDIVFSPDADCIIVDEMDDQSTLHVAFGTAVAINGRVDNLPGLATYRPEITLTNDPSVQGPLQFLSNKRREYRRAALNGDSRLIEKAKVELDEAKFFYHDAIKAHRAKSTR